MHKEQERLPYHIQTGDEVLKEVDSSKEGLTSSQAQSRLEAYGKNELEEGENRGLPSLSTNSRI